MDTSHIARLLEPYLGEGTLSDYQLSQISAYVDVLLKWNARMNLTAVRDPEQIVQRHFGESFFAARHLLQTDSVVSLADVGSGAGFPGIPMKLYAPGAQVTLIEAHGKKATFLREVIRALALTNIDVFGGRAEQWQHQADLVMLRAVEKFEEVLPVATGLVRTGGRLAVLIGENQVGKAASLLPGAWDNSLPIPESRERVLKVWRNR